MNSYTKHPDHGSDALAVRPGKLNLQFEEEEKKGGTKLWLILRMGIDRFKGGKTAELFMRKEKVAFMLKSLSSK